MGFARYLQLGSMTQLVKIDSKKILPQNVKTTTTFGSFLEPLSLLSQNMSLLPGDLLCASRNSFLQSWGSGCVVLVWSFKSLFWNLSHFNLYLFQAAWPGITHIQHTMTLSPLLIVSEVPHWSVKNIHLLKLVMLLCSCPLKGHLHPRMLLKHS